MIEAQHIPVSASLLHIVPKSHSLFPLPCLAGSQAISAFRLPTSALLISHSFSPSKESSNNLERQLKQPVRSTIFSLRLPNSEFQLPYLAGSQATSVSPSLLHIVPKSHSLLPISPFPLPTSPFRLNSTPPDTPPSPLYQLRSHTVSCDWRESVPFDRSEKDFPTRSSGPC